MWFKSSFTIPVVAAISFCVIGGTTPAHADLGDQLFELLPDDGASSDKFANSVGISGSTAIAGGHLNDDNGDYSGSAYLFDTTTGKQIAKLLADDGGIPDNFGVSVAVSGSIAIVGARADDNDNGFFAGSAYLFDISDPANPVQISHILADDGAEGDFFGFSVAISGTTTIVGAFFHDHNGNDSGSAYLFDATFIPPCPWDLDGNNDVGVGDLLILLGAWGPCKGCPADFDGNGTVGASDLLALLVNWGPCP